MRPTAVAIWAVLVLGCSSEVGAIVLTVDGDLAPGADLDGLDVGLWREGAQIWSESYGLGGGSFPVTYRIEQPSARAGVVEMSVEATLGGRAQLEARRSATFVTGQEVSVEVCLLQRCLDAPDLAGCPEGLCGDGGGEGGDGDADADGDVDSAPDGTDLLCNDNCDHAGDGRCDDGGEGSRYDYCDFGTDCMDCGSRRAGDCVPRSCEGRECGSDGCGGSCGEGCSTGELCEAGGQCVEWVEVPAATFEMGAPEDEFGFGNDETQHAVVLTRPFRIAAREVSRSWFRGVMGIDPSLHVFCDGDCPVDGVSWHAAAQFCNEISRAQGLQLCYECEGPLGAALCELSPHLDSPYDCGGYRLPTEAEWEHAARAGTATATYNGDLDPAMPECETPNAVLETIAWYCGNAESAQPSGLLAPNAFGLYDVLGNLLEWVHDYYGDFSGAGTRDPWGPASATNRVARGCAYNEGADACRAAERYSIAPDRSSPNISLRPAITLR